MNKTVISKSRTPRKMKDGTFRRTQMVIYKQEVGKVKGKTKYKSYTMHEPI